jgi:hypothetical protein
VREQAVDKYDGPVRERSIGKSRDTILGRVHKPDGPGENLHYGVCSQFGLHNPFLLAAVTYRPFHTPLATIPLGTGIAVSGRGWCPPRFTNQAADEGFTDKCHCCIRLVHDVGSQKRPDAAEESRIGLLLEQVPLKLGAIANEGSDESQDSAQHDLSHPPASPSAAWKLEPGVEGSKTSNRNSFGGKGYGILGINRGGRRGKAFQRVAVFERWARVETGVIFLAVGVYFSLVFIFKAR